MISAESVEFLPVVLANCCIGWIAWGASSLFQLESCVVVQSPYARLIVGVPYFAISSSSSVVSRAVVLSESIRTASRVVSGAATPRIVAEREDARYGPAAAR